MSQTMSQTMSEVRIGEVDWQRAHEELIRIARCRGEMDFEEGEWMLVALRTGAHAALGFASFAEYAERHLGYKPRWTAERLRVAEALESLPETAEALRSGAFTWSAVRELTRVATTETEGDWLKHTAGRPVRQIESMVSGRERGARPGDRPDPRKVRHVLRYEVTAEVLALFREAVNKLRRDAGGPLDDDALLLQMARQVLGGPSDAGRASYQIAVNVCSHCGGGSIQGAGEAIDVAPEVVAMACCDAQHLGDVSATHVGAPVRAKQEIPPATRRLVERRDGGRCVVPGCRNSVWVDIHHIDPRAEGGGHEPDGLATMCCAHHRAVHEGRLVIEGRASTGFLFFHADGTAYGRSVSPQRADMSTKVFNALRANGFKETESRRAIAEARARVGPDASVEELLRAALGAAAARATR